MSLTFIRNKIKSDKTILNFINNKFWLEYLIRYSNSWFIVIPKNSESVFKFYFGKFYFDTNINSKFTFLDTYNNELTCYKDFKSNWLIIPKIYWTWIEYIWKFKFYFLELQNIRLNNIKLFSFFDINLSNLVHFIKKIHFLHPWYILWNIDISNFYIDTIWNIWFFDFSSYWFWFIEKDLAKIFFWYEFKYEYIIKVISVYWENFINIPKLLFELNSVFIENNKMYKNNFYISFKVINWLNK